MRLLIILLLFLLVAPAVALADDITWVNDGGDGWDTAESVAAADMDQIKTQVDDNNAELAAIQSGADATIDTEWDTAAEINTATTDTDMVLDTDIGATVEAFDADITKLNEVETLSANWVNTANPWAENELVSTVVVESEVGTLTISASAASGSCTAGDVWWETTSSPPVQYGCTATDTWESF